MCWKTAFWYRVVTDWSFRIEPGSSPLEDEMEYVEGAPSHYFGDQEFIDILNAAHEYVTRFRRRRRKKPRPESEEGDAG